MTDSTKTICPQIFNLEGIKITEKSGMNMQLNNNNIKEMLIMKIIIGTTQSNPDLKPYRVILMRYQYTKFEGFSTTRFIPAQARVITSIFNI